MLFELHDEKIKNIIEINKICKDNSIYHISDEAYEYFTYDEIEHFSPCSIDNSEEYTILDLANKIRDKINTNIERQ